MTVVNAWNLYAHPLFLEQLEKLTAAVESARVKDPVGFASTADAKLLAVIQKLIFENIPADPSRPEYRQGGTLGASREHWFRAKFGNGRFRLFFRYSISSKIIVYAWVNDRDTMRAYGSKTDAYAVFKAMLDKDRPPDDWATLLSESPNLPR
jgi:toxin YhaV